MILNHLTTIMILILVIWTQKNKSGTQIPANKIIKKIQNIARKKPSKTIVFVKQVPVHPKDGLAGKT